MSARFHGPTGGWAGPGPSARPHDDGQHAEDDANRTTGAMNTFHDARSSATPRAWTASRGRSGTITPRITLAGWRSAGARNVLFEVTAVEGVRPPAGVPGGVGSAPAQQSLAAGDGDLDRDPVLVQTVGLRILVQAGHQQDDGDGEEHHQRRADHQRPGTAGVDVHSGAPGGSSPDRRATSAAHPVGMPKEPGGPRAVARTSSSAGPHVAWRSTLTPLRCSNDPRSVAAGTGRLRGRGPASVVLTGPVRGGRRDRFVPRRSPAVKRRPR